MSGNKNSGRRPGYRHTLEVREQMSAAQQALWTEERRLAKSEAMRGQSGGAARGWETRRRAKAEAQVAEKRAGETAS
jgi:hypothetical protein